MSMLMPQAFITLTQRHRDALAYLRALALKLPITYAYTAVNVSKLANQTLKVSETTCGRRDFGQKSGHFRLESWQNL